MNYTLLLKFYGGQQLRWEGQKPPTTNGTSSTTAESDSHSDQQNILESILVA